LCLTAAGSRAAAQSAGCPLQLKSVDLLPARSLGPAHLGYDFSRNLERVLRVRYKNISGKEIASAHLSVSISLYEPGPIHAKTTYGEQDLALTSRLPAGKEKTLKEKVLTSGVPPRVWVREITYYDGSRWTPSDPGQCQYSPRPIQTSTGLLTPPL
jgi:hypothetical protein